MDDSTDQKFSPVSRRHTRKTSTREGYRYDLVDEGNANKGRV